MSNDECRMTKEIRNPKPEIRSCLYAWYSSHPNCSQVARIFRSVAERGHSCPQQGGEERGRTKCSGPWGARSLLRTRMSALRLGCTSAAPGSSMGVRISFIPPLYAGRFASGAILQNSDNCLGADSPEWERT